LHFHDHNATAVLAEIWACYRRSYWSSQLQLPTAETKTPSVSLHQSCTLICGGPRVHIFLRCCIASHDPKKPGGTAPAPQLMSEMRVYSRADLCAVCRSLQIGRSRASWSPAVHNHISLNRKRKRTPACHSEAGEADDSTGDSQEAQPSTERQPTNASEHDTPASSTDPKTVDWREFRCAIAWTDRHHGCAVQFAHMCNVNHVHWSHNALHIVCAPASSMSA